MRIGGKQFNIYRRGRMNESAGLNFNVIEF